MTISKLTLFHKFCLLNKLRPTNKIGIKNISIILAVLFKFTMTLAAPPRFGEVVFNPNGPYGDSIPELTMQIDDKFYDILIFSPSKNTYYQLVPVSETNNTPMFIPVLSLTENNKSQTNAIPGFNLKFEGARMVSESGQTFKLTGHQSHTMDDSKIMLELFVSSTESADLNSHRNYWKYTPLNNEFNKKSVTVAKFKSQTDFTNWLTNIGISSNSCEGIYR